QSLLPAEEFLEQLRKVPDGNRILGGFCSAPELRDDLYRLQSLAQRCREKLRSLRDGGSTQGNVYAGLLTTTIVSGVAAITSGAIGASTPNGQEVGAWMFFGFGTVTLIAAVINDLGGFRYRYREAKRQATRLDNLMWTMRLRVGVEVCNASSEQQAQVKLQNITHRLQSSCAEQYKDDGVYRPRSSR
ncbi:MAG: hypothetical protein AAGJ35_08865, partial [Myxococcota bacterium]